MAFLPERPIILNFFAFMVFVENDYAGDVVNETFVLANKNLALIVNSCILLYCRFLSSQPDPLKVN